MLFLLALLGDSSVMYEFPDGCTVAMISDANVSMAAESVFITPAAGIHECSAEHPWLPDMSVRCVFELVNRSGEEQFLSVGFPLDARYGEAYTAMDDSMLFEVLAESYSLEYRPAWSDESVIQALSAEDDIAEDMDFRAFINGEEVPVYFRKCALSRTEDLVWQPVVAVWKMHFQPGETVFLENTYNTSWDFFGGGPWSEYTVNYILTSGGTWRGPIGDAFISLAIPPELPLPVLNDTTAVYWSWSGSPVINGRTVVWKFTDLEPMENLSFFVVTESRLSHWDYFLNPAEMYDALDWTGDDLLWDATQYVADALVWNPVFDAALTTRILEALPFIVRQQMPPNGLYTGIFINAPLNGGTALCPVDIDRFEIAEQIGEEVQRNIDLTEESGYLEFLPMFALKWSWDEGALGLYAGMPEKQGRYLELLQWLEPAAGGEYISDPAIRAFYELTGWYHQGDSSRVSLHPLLETHLPDIRFQND